MLTTYVLSDDGKWYVQGPYIFWPFDFALFDEDRSYPGGVGIGSWKAVRHEDVPDDVRNRMDWMLESLLEVEEWCAKKND